jgi:hypothetical protein
MTPLPRWLRWALGVSYGVIFVAVLALVNLNLRAALIATCNFIVLGTVNYFWGWYARERMIEKRDPELEELRGRGQ